MSGDCVRIDGTRVVGDGHRTGEICGPITQNEEAKSKVDGYGYCTVIMI